MANSKFSEKCNSDKHGMHTNDLHSIQSSVPPELLLQRNGANICYSSKKAFSGSYLEIYSKKLFFNHCFAY